MELAGLQFQELERERRKRTHAHDDKEAGAEAAEVEDGGAGALDKVVGVGAAAADPVGDGGDDVGGDDEQGEVGMEEGAGQDDEEEAEGEDKGERNDGLEPGGRHGGRLFLGLLVWCLVGVLGMQSVRVWKRLLIRSCALAWKLLFQGRSELAALLVTWDGFRPDEKLGVRRSVGRSRRIIKNRRLVYCARGCFLCACRWWRWQELLDKAEEGKSARGQDSRLSKCDVDRAAGGGGCCSGGWFGGARDWAGGEEACVSRRPGRIMVLEMGRMERQGTGDTKDNKDDGLKRSRICRLFYGIFILSLRKKGCTLAKASRVSKMHAHSL